MFSWLPSSFIVVNSDTFHFIFEYINLISDSQGSVSCFNSGRNRPRDTLFFQPPVPLLSSHHLQNHLQDQPTYLNSHCPTTMSSQICQNYPTEVEAAVPRLPTCLCWPPTPTSLWASISTLRMWLSGQGPLLPRVGGEEVRVR